MKGRRPSISALLKVLLDRGLGAGGFSNRPGGEFRIDATAWGAVALLAAGTAKDVLEEARSRLAAEQAEDGRLGISADHPEAWWPTPLAILAWQGSRAHRGAQSRAAEFLLRTTGIQFAKDPASPVQHDTSIPGWSWVANSHSMVEPTALSLLALGISGHGRHERAREASRLLLDRQLPAGGWNYGNTFVYGKALYPLPESTGLALDALAGRVSRGDVARSLGYLETRLAQVRAPLSLGWGLLGLGAWGARPADAERRVSESLALQEEYGPFDTTLLSLLLVSGLAARGLESALPRNEFAG